MKKIIGLVLTGLLAISLAACGSAGESKEPETPQIPDLSGEWVQSNSESESSYQAATITEDTIEIFWINEENDSKALYWAGTFEAPKSADAYSWDSVNDHEKTDSALLASGDDTKTFQYEDDIISYEASAMGVTKTVKLGRK